MNTPVNVTPNGRVQRKSLASQIDRLDAMLDGLADAIPEVIADTIRAVAAHTVRDAVQAAVAEVFASPQVLDQLRGSAAAAVPVAQVAPPVCAKRPGARGRLRSLLRQVGTALTALRQACRARLHSAGVTLVSVWQRATARVAVLGPPLRMLAAFKYPLLAAAGVGAAVATAAWFAGPYLATALSGIGGFGTAVAVQGGCWVRRMASLGILARG